MPSSSTQRSARRQGLSLVLRMVFFALFLFVPAGTWRWPEGWLFLSIYLVWAALMGRWLLRHDPELLKERLDLNPAQKGQKGWDKVFMIASIVVGLPILIVPGLDAVRYQWTHVPWPLKAIGMIGMIPCLFVIFQVMKANTYLSRVVKIDTARGHHVITTGPYRYVRHPMYAAIIGLLPCMALALGSLVTLIPAVLLAVMVVMRTYLEDRTLHSDLPGYREYAQKTPYRLIPGLW